MARSLRIEYEGAYYHVMARGNRREVIFLDDEDRRTFLQVLAEACEKTGWQVHAWVLMDNHYHLFIETPEANLVEGMKWLQNTVTRRFNVRHAKWGRLFGDRYKAVLVEGEEASAYTTLWEYIHLNPHRAGLVKAAQGQSVLNYPWSSLAGGYALMPSRRAKWLAAGKGFAILGYKDTSTGRQKMVRQLDARGAAEGRKSGLIEPNEGADGRRSHLRDGWYWGSQEFAEWALELVAHHQGKRRSRAYKKTKELLAHGESEAEKIIQKGLSAGGLKEGELEALRANDPRKAALARLAWKRTTVSQPWIAKRLEMKSAANVSIILHRTDWEKVEHKLPASPRKYVKEL